MLVVIQILHPPTNLLASFFVRSSFDNILLEAEPRSDGTFVSKKSQLVKAFEKGEYGKKYVAGFFKDGDDNYQLVIKKEECKQIS